MARSNVLDADQKRRIATWLLRSIVFYARYAREGGDNADKWAAFAAKYMTERLRLERELASGTE